MSVTSKLARQILIEKAEGLERHAKTCDDFATASERLAIEERDKAETARTAAKELRDVSDHLAAREGITI